MLTHGLSGGVFATGEMWRDAAVALPSGVDAGSFINVLTGETIVAESEGGVARVRLAPAFATLPLALLVRRDPA
ncbi:MAG: hypothetical protein M3Q55_17110 [Acidobacteriota bacterium]|nr:hypothetical protein [Acidobacteriota bacterium]